MSRMLTRKLTQARRAKMLARVRSIKLNHQKMSTKTREQLNRLFLEAKWFTNYIIANDGKVKTTAKSVPVKLKDGTFEERNLIQLTAQMKQDLLQRFVANCKSIKTNKARGNIKSGGRIKFVSEVNSIPIRGEGVIFRDQAKFGKNYVKLPKLGNFKFHGAHQLKHCELASAVLIRKASGYFVNIATFTDPQISNIKTTKSGKDKQKISPPAGSEGGLDFGISATITTSDGDEIKISVEESEPLKNLRRKFSRCEMGSNNRRKLKRQIKKESEHLTNKRYDAANKISSIISSMYEKVVIQDENVEGWHSGLFGKQLQRSCAGRLKQKLINNGAIVVDRYFPSTKQCYVCGTRNVLTLNDREYQCTNCGHLEHRDVKAARAILIEGGGSCNATPIMETKLIDLNQPTYVDLIINSSGSDERLLDEADNNFNVIFAESGLSNLEAHELIHG